MVFRGGRVPAGFQLPNLGQGGCEKGRGYGHESQAEYQHEDREHPTTRGDGVDVSVADGR